jgi:hypothetical protein
MKLHLTVTEGLCFMAYPDDTEDVVYERINDKYCREVTKLIKFLTNQYSQKRRASI